MTNASTQSTKSDTNNNSSVTNDGINQNLASHIISASGLSSDELMPLTPIFDVICKRFYKSLSDYTSTELNAEVAFIEALSSSNIPEIIGKKNVIVSGRIEKWSSEILMVVSPELIDLMTSSFFGASNFLDEMDDKTKSLKPSLQNQNTKEDISDSEDPEELDQTIVEQFVYDTFANIMAQSISHTFDYENKKFLKFDKSFSSARLHAEEYFSSRFFHCRIKLKIQHFYTYFDLLFPGSCHRFIQNAITKMLQISSNWVDPIWTKRMHEEIQKTDVPVSATIKQGKSTLSNINNLKVGQILPLAPDSAQNILVSSQNKPLYIGILGKVNNYLSIKIEKIINEKTESK